MIIVIYICRIVNALLVYNYSMQSMIFPYDKKWESVEFSTPTKKIISFQDVTEYQQRPIHD